MNFVVSVGQISSSVYPTLEGRNMCLEEINYKMEIFMTVVLRMKKKKSELS